MQPQPNLTLPPQPTPTLSCRPRFRTQKQISDAEEAFLPGLEERSCQMMTLQHQVPVLGQLRPSTDRERDAFIDLVRSVINELDNGLSRCCQQEISNTLYRYIGENDQLKRQQAPASPTPSTSTQFRQPFQPLQGSSQACSAM